MSRVLAPPGSQETIWRGVMAAAKMREAIRQRPYESGRDWGRNRDAEPYPWQIEPAGWRRLWLMLGGRGTGKTELGARRCIEHLREHGPRARVGIGAPTIADARSVCAEGETGLITLFASEFPSYNRTFLEARHRLGGYVRFLGAEEPGRWNGPQWTFLWADELALWNRDAWDQADFGLRLGDQPRCIATTTPKAKKWIQEIVLDSADDSSGIVVTRGTTYDATGLSEDAKERWRRRYEGTRLGRQELLAEFIAEIEGAMWRQDWIDGTRLRTAPDLERVVVAIDPSGSDDEGASLQGIVSAGRAMCACKGATPERHYFVLRDDSGHYTPNEWGAKAIAAYRQFSADRIVGEANFGGQMVENTIRTIDPTVSYKAVTASRGKQVRAEPIAALSEQAKVHFVGSFPDLEEQLCNWTPGMKSPDRLDAFVWALTELNEGAAWYAA